MMHLRLQTSLLLDSTQPTLAGSALMIEVWCMPNLTQGINDPPFQPSYMLSPFTPFLVSPFWEKGEKLHALVSATAFYIYFRDNICNPTQALIFCLD